MLLFIKPFSETNDDRLEKVSWNTVENAATQPCAI
jgi:hypothetical protein